MYVLSFLLAIFLSWISELKWYLILLILFNLNFVWSLRPDILAASIKLSLFIFKITKKYIVIFFNIITLKKTSKISFAWFLFANIKSMNPMQKYPHIIELFELTELWTYWTLSSLLNSENACFYVFMFNQFFNFFRSMFNSKTVKTNNFDIL